jgi:hypothetical protein
MNKVTLTLGALLLFTVVNAQKVAPTSSSTEVKKESKTQDLNGAQPLNQSVKMHNEVPKTRTSATSKPVRKEETIKNQ